MSVETIHADGQLHSSLEEQPHAFVAVSGAATIFAIIITIWGNKTLRRVRRVALSGKSLSSRPTSIRVFGSPAQRSPASAVRPSSDPGTGASGSVETRPSLRMRITSTPIGPRRSLVDWLLRRNRIGRNYEETPVWINEKADRARMRDAFLAEMQGLKGKVAVDGLGVGDGEGHGDGHGVDGLGGKWGRGKAKWAKE